MSKGSCTENAAGKVTSVWIDAVASRKTSQKDHGANDQRKAVREQPASGLRSVRSCNGLEPKEKRRRARGCRAATAHAVIPSHTVDTAVVHNKHANSGALASGHQERLDGELKQPIFGSEVGSNDAAACDANANPIPKISDEAKKRCLEALKGPNFICRPFQAAQKKVVSVPGHTDAVTTEGIVTQRVLTRSATAAAGVREFQELAVRSRSIVPVASTYPFLKYFRTFPSCGAVKVGTGPVLGRSETRGVTNAPPLACSRKPIGEESSVVPVQARDGPQGMGEAANVQGSVHGSLQEVLEGPRDEYPESKISLKNVQRRVVAEKDRAEEGRTRIDTSRRKRQTRERKPQQLSTHSLTRSTLSEGGADSVNAVQSRERSCEGVLEGERDKEEAKKLSLLRFVNLLLLGCLAQQRVSPFLADLHHQIYMTDGVRRRALPLPLWVIIDDDKFFLENCEDLLVSPSLGLPPGFSVSDVFSLFKLLQRTIWPAGGLKSASRRELKSSAPALHENAEFDEPVWTRIETTLAKKRKHKARAERKGYARRLHAFSYAFLFAVYESIEQGWKIGRRTPQAITRPSKAKVSRQKGKANNTTKAASGEEAVGFPENGAGDNIKCAGANQLLKIEDVAECKEVLASQRVRAPFISWGLQPQLPTTHPLFQPILLRHACWASHT